MALVKIEIQGRIPSKKNSLRRIKRGNAIFTVPSEKHEAWEKSSLPLLFGIKKKVKPMHVIIEFHMPDNRRTDLTNKAESIMDLLVKGGILEDDSWQITGPMTLIPCGISKEKPMAVVYLDEGAGDATDEKRPRFVLP